MQRYSYNWYIQQFTDATNELKKLQQTYAAPQFSIKLAPHIWSATECVQHLNKFGILYARRIENVLQNERQSHHPEHTSMTFKPGVMWRVAALLFEPPYRLKMPTVSDFEPKAASKSTISMAVSQFHQLQGRFSDQLQLCSNQRLSLNKLRISHPILPWISVPLSAAFVLIAAHQRRHLWQAQQTIKQR